METKNRYSNEEIVRIQKEFNINAAQNRRKQLTGLAVFAVVFLIGLILVFLTPSDYKNPATWLFIAFFAISFFVLGKILPGLKCSGCHQLLEGSFGTYCPVCSGSQLRVDENNSRAFCPSCNRKLQYRASSSIGTKNFKIRACTHCGAPLSRSGF